MPSRRNPDSASLKEALELHRSRSINHHYKTPREGLDTEEERGSAGLFVGLHSDSRGNVCDYEQHKQDLKRTMDGRERLERRLFQRQDGDVEGSSTVTSAEITSAETYGVPDITNIVQGPSKTALLTGTALPNFSPTQSIVYDPTLSKSLVSSSSTTVIQTPYTEASSASPTLASKNSSGDDDLSQSARIGLGVGVGIGVPLLAALIACFFVARRRKRSRMGVGGKYTEQGNSDVSMVESPIPESNPPARQAEMQFYEPPKSFEPQNYRFNPANDFENYHTPVSAVTPLEPNGSRELPPNPPPLTIPNDGATPRHSFEPSLARPDSPVSPISPVSALSPEGSRPPSPKHRD